MDETLKFKKQISERINKANSVLASVKPDWKVCAAQDIIIIITIKYLHYIIHTYITFNCSLTAQSRTHGRLDS